MGRVFRLPDEPRRAEGDVRREIDLHLEYLVRELEATGLSPEEARRRALESFGDPDRVAASVRPLRGATIRARRRRERLADFAHDLRIAVRGLRRSPGFTLVAVLTLALGIGANAAIFGVVRSVLLAPLPYPEPDRLVQLWTDERAHGRTAPEWLTPADFLDWRRESRTFASMGAYNAWQPDLTGDGEPETLIGAAVSPELLPTLNGRVALGRDFRPDDDDPGAARVTILSDGFWRRRFGADRSLIGRPIVLNGEPWTVIGVLPPGFRPPMAPTRDLWRPLRLTAGQAACRGCIFLRAIGRLRPGVTVADARQDLSLIAARLEREYPETNKDRRVWLIPLAEQLTGASRPALVALAGAVGFVLLIGCVNLANLLLVRGAGRGREIAVRSALGAGRGRLLRQLLTESAVLAATGGLLGFLAAFLARGLLLSAVPEAVRAIQPVRIDGLVLAFTAVLSLGAGLLFGLVPALRAARADLMGMLRTSGQRGSKGDQRLRAGLVVAELALSVMLLVGAGLLLRSFVGMQRVDLGYRTEGLVTASVTFPRSRYGDLSRTTVAIEDLLSRLRAHPAIAGAELTDRPPLGGGDQDLTFAAVGEPPVQGNPSVWYRSVSPGYLGLMGMRVGAGRGLEPGDRAGGARVAVVNQEMAARYWGGKSPIGRILSTGDTPSDLQVTVVGVVANAHADGPGQPVKPELFVPVSQLPSRGVTVVFRPRAGAVAATDALRQTLKQVDPLIPIASVVTMTDALARELAPPRTYATLVGGFALAALILASLGVYGVMAYSVAQRQREIGVRLALGAGPGAIRRLVLSESARLAAIGLLVGLGAAALLTRAIRTLLFEVGPTDPVTFAAAPLVLGLVTLLAAWLPATRAVRTDPLIAMREE